MKTLKMMIKSERGFTLIELMITVAIVGILASMATQQFQVFKMRAKQSEAKANLAALYQAEKIFFNEFNGYTGDFRDIGLAISGRLVFDIGFGRVGYVPGSPFMPKESADCEAGSAFNTEVSLCALTPGSYQAQAMFENASPGNGCAAGSNPTPLAFRATAIGLLNGRGVSSIPDIWTIDENKSLCHNQVGD